MLRRSASRLGSTLHFEMPRFFVNVQYLDKTNRLVCRKLAVALL